MATGTIKALASKADMATSIYVQDSSQTGNGLTIVCRRSGNVVSCRLTGTLTNAVSYNNVLATIGNSDYRPSQECYGIYRGYGSSNIQYARVCKINSSGEIIPYWSIEQNAEIELYVVYIVNG